MYEYQQYHEDRTKEQIRVAMGDEKLTEAQIERIATSGLYINKYIYIYTPNLKLSNTSNTQILYIYIYI